MERRPIHDFIERLPENEKKGCLIALALLRYFDEEFHSTKGHQSYDVDELLAGLKVVGDAVLCTPSAIAWVRQHLHLSEDKNALVTGPMLTQAGFTTGVLEALELQDEGVAWAAVLDTSLGRLLCFVREKIILNLDDPSAGLFFDPYF